VKESVDAERLEDLEQTAVREPPLAEAVGARGSAVKGRAAELADEKRERIRDPRDGDRDVVEQDAIHEAAVYLSAR
jgi:hypothetical protein